MIEPAPRHRFGQGVRYAVVAAGLLVALAGTWMAGRWHTARVETRGVAAQEEAVAQALAYAETQLAALQRDLRTEAQALAVEPVVLEALRGLRQDQIGATEALVAFFAEQTLPHRRAAEVYDADLQLVAWNGYSMPHEAPPNPSGTTTTVAQDGVWRQALTLWAPVRAGARTLGFIRLMEVLETETPVRNQYLQPFSILQDWRRQTGVRFDARFGVTCKEDLNRHQQTLHSLDGAVLGCLEIEYPDTERLSETVRERYADVLAFWATLLLVWLVMGTWAGYRTLARTPSHHRARLVLGFALVGALWWGARFALLALRVPARWQRGKAPLAPLFDPAHFASTFGSGLLRSPGDFLLTAVFALLFAFAMLDWAARLQARRTRPLNPIATGRALALWCGAVVLVTLFTVALVLVLSLVARHTVLDSTLDYFARSGLLPEPLVLVIFCALLLTTVAVVAIIVGMGWITLGVRAHFRTGSRSALLLTTGVAMAAPIAILANVLAYPLPWLSIALFALVGAGLAVTFLPRHGTGQGLSLLTLRSVLPLTFLASLMLYPMFYGGMEAQRRIRMLDAADTFDDRRDPRVIFAIEQLLEEGRSEPAVAALLAGVPTDSIRTQLDSVAAVLLRGSMLASLGAYDVSLTFLDDRGEPVGRYDADPRQSRAVLDQSDALEFPILQQMHAESSADGALVEPLTGRQDPDRLQYGGIAPVGTRGWLLARAEPQTLLQDGATPFPRVLLPTGLYGEHYATLSLAEFRSGVLVRSFGRDFGRYRLDERVQQTLLAEPELWNRETVKERSYLTYYRRQEAPAAPQTSGRVAVGPSVVAVRTPAIEVFDHLYYLLRLTVAGLMIGLSFFVLGLWLRRRAGLLPAPRVRFRDKVLNAFLGVGLIAVAAVGFIGLRVVTGENDRAVRSWLRQHLQRVEETLALDAQGGEMPYRVLDRVGLDSAAALVGLDLNLYDGPLLVESSRPQLVRERLIDPRLPIQAFDALHFDGYRFTYVEEHLGSFDYTAGYYALLDEQGAPRYVLSVPTLPEQERIEEERARTVAYLFGALLILMLAVMLTALLMANALARPIARLRAGLEAVAAGHFERALPVETRDEVGELVATFNTMQEQLAESRRRLARQERQLAWREMARQVAHEIKNPLTPMKLSVQHLRRAYQDAADADGAVPEGRFAGLFDRVTMTLIEQMDALVRIANDFSTFARLPRRVLERLDLNAVVREAVALMEAEADAEIATRLHPQPLILEADREELRRLYINLIKNALQAVPDDRGARVVVTTDAEPSPNGTPGTARSTVEDNGGGIPADLRSKIFEPNFSTKTSGTGLGLAIVKKSIEELNGEIGFETTEGAGTTFWIRLPLVD